MFNTRFDARKETAADFSMQSMEEIVHNFADLESCCYRRLENVYGVAKEAVGNCRLAIKICTKVTPRFEHCTCTNFRINDESHGGRNDPLRGLGQGRMLSG